MSHRRHLLAGLLFATCLIVSGLASAEVTLCLKAQSDRDDTAGLTSLIRSEVARHPSHRIVEQRCEQTLTADLFHAGTTRYLSLGIAGQVPERQSVPDGSPLDGAVTHAVSLVLGNDPLSLTEDPAKFSALERDAHSVLVKGHNTYRLELFQLVTRTDTNYPTTPGAAVSFARGAQHWQVFARLHASGWPGTVRGSHRVVKLSSGFDLGLQYETSLTGFATPYFGASIGMLLMSLDGRYVPSDPKSLESVVSVGLDLGLRAGVRAMRWLDFDVDAFTAVRLPMFATHETDGHLFGDKGIYTPQLELGIGVGF